MVIAAAAGSHWLTTLTCDMKSTWMLSRVWIVASFLTLVFTAVSTSSHQMDMGIIHNLKCFSTFSLKFVVFLKYLYLYFLFCHQWNDTIGIYIVVVIVSRQACQPLSVWSNSCSMCYTYWLLINITSLVPINFFIFDQGPLNNFLFVVPLVPDT